MQQKGKKKMQLAEFDRNIKRLQDKWKTIFSKEQVHIIFEKWKHLPDGVFDTSVQMVLFKCTATPSGERIQEEINLTLELRRRNVVEQTENKNGCSTCKGKGYLVAEKSNGSQIPFLCAVCAGKGVHLNFPLPKYAEVERQGYSLKKKLSNIGKTHAEWKNCDETKYSAKLQGIYNIVQRSMLLNDSRGLKGIQMLLKISKEETFKLYELMVQGNTSDEMIKKYEIHNTKTTAAI
jgi:hypothetical protein